MKPKVCGAITDWKRPNGEEGYGAIGWYRIKNALEKMGYPVVGKLTLGKPEHALALKEKGDIWLWKPVDNEGMNVIIDTAKAFTNSKLILDIDDEPFDINEAHPLYDEIKSKSDRVRRMIEISDYLIVSTPALKESLKGFGKRIAVIPNAIDPKIWDVKKKKRTDGKIRIGWMGSASHMADLGVINGAFDEILEKYPNVEIHLAGFSAKDDSRSGREFLHHGTNGYEEYPQFVADLDLDIAVAPLIDSKFNRAKSNIKWMEHAMLGTPMVLSDVTPYSSCVKNYKTGYLAKNKSQWVKYLSWLIESEEKRKEIGEAARKEVLDNWTIDKFIPMYEKVFETVREKNITVYTSVIGDFDHMNHLESKQNTEGANFVAFSDTPSEVWDVRNPYDKFKLDRRNSRAPKILPHLFMDTEYSVYMDGNVALNVPAQTLIDEFLKDKDVAVFRHMGRDCVYDEANACVALKKGDIYEIAEQVRSYAEKGWPPHNGLAECNVIIRRHTKEVEEMNEKWWAHYCRYSERDQISFPLAFPLEKVNLIEGAAWRHPYFTFVGHKQEENNVRL